MRDTLPSGTPVEVARPSGEPVRGLVVVPDIMGLRPLVEEQVRRLAEGNAWAVAAVETWPGREHLSREERMGLVATIDEPALLEDLRAAADLLGVEPVGVTGFCLGGMYALKAAGTGRFARAVSFYGMIRAPEEWKSPGSREPLDAVSAPEACPTLALIGGVDPWTPDGDVEALEAAGVEVVRYEEADHGFAHDPDRPAHRPDDAADAWRRAVAFLSG